MLCNAETGCDDRSARCLPRAATATFPPSAESNLTAEPSYGHIFSSAEAAVELQIQKSHHAMQLLLDASSSRLRHAFGS